MAEQYRDSYQNQYREETAQIHAPKSLIEKTKAAVREEEMWLAREAAPVGAYVQSEAKAENRKTFSNRKWAYPLTAAAALLILVSVSWTMRGLKSESEMSASPAYEEAAESGAAYEESVAEAAFEDTVAESEEGAVDFAVGEAEASAAEEIAEAPAAGVEFLEDAAADAAQTDGFSRGQAEKFIEDKLSSIEAGTALTENALKKEPASAEEAKNETADAEGLTIEKVAKHPVRFYTSDVKIRSYEGVTFRILEGKDGGNAREAYVETEDGGRYVLQSETLNEEEFLAAAREKLIEIE